MATSERSVTESIRDDFLTCNICLEVYTDPRILPCLHTYCFQCVCSHVDTAEGEGRPALCPECRAPVPEAVSSLKKNFFINGLAEIIKEKSNDGTSCTACKLRGSEVAAKSKCLDCGDYLCSSCSDGHNASSLTWKHEKIPLDDIKEGKYDEKLRQLQKIRCPKHDTKDVEFYCETCSKSVCMTCVLLEHRQHSCKTITEAAAEKRPSLIDLTEKLRKRFASTEKEEKELSQELEKAKASEDIKRKSIMSTAERDIQSIMSKRDADLEKLSLSTKTVKEDLERKLDVIREGADGLGSCITFSDNILRRGKDEEVLMLESMLTHRLVQLQEPVSATNEPKQKGDKQDMEETSSTPYQQKPLVVLSHLKTLFTKCNADKEKQDIRGMAYSSKLGLVVSDHLNGKIKIISKTGSLVQVLTNSDFHPYAVAVTGDHIGAISGNRLLIFSSKGNISAQVELTDKMPEKHFFFTYSLAASEAGTIGFVVGNILGEDRLRFYSTSGSFIRYLYCSVKCPLAALSVTPTRNLVLCEWGSSQLRAITSEGKPIFKIHKTNWKPNGTCTSRDGIVFIAEYNSGGVSAYSSKEKTLEFVHKTKSEGINSPQFVVLDELEHLYVADNSGRICMYKCCR